MLIRPFELADHWKVSSHGVLKVCLLAARIGIIDLKWRVLCPIGRSAKDGVDPLTGIKSQVHCETCNVQFDAQFDRSVEVYFQLSKSIRNVPTTTYCIGGPGLTPHIVAQWVLRPNEQRNAKVTLPTGRYRLYSQQCSNDHTFIVSPAAQSSEDNIEVRVEVENAKNRRLHFYHPENCTQSANWNFTNNSIETIVLRIETPQWVSVAATAAEVTTLQMFRDQFGSEALSPGTEMAIQHICFLFSDLKGSTAVYKDQGGISSYKTVRNHFEFMTYLIKENDGAVVKTIGDAVMAVFGDPADALRVALEIQLRSFTEQHPLEVKLGIHFGPAIAVNANGILDYFGHTVNVAARLQRLCVGGDIIVTAPYCTDTVVKRVLSQYSVKQTRFTSQLKGIEDDFDLIRLELNHD